MVHHDPRPVLPPQRSASEGASIEPLSSICLGRRRIKTCEPGYRPSRKSDGSAAGRRTRMPVATSSKRDQLDLIPSALPIFGSSTCGDARRPQGEIRMNPRCTLAAGALALAAAYPAAAATPNADQPTETIIVTATRCSRRSLTSMKRCATSPRKRRAISPSASL